MFYVSSNLLRLFIIGNFRVTLSHQTWQKDISDFNSGSVHHIVMYTENQLKSILVSCDCEPLMWTGAICASLPAEDLFSCDRARNVHQFMFMPRALRSWCTVCLESINKQVLVFSIQGCTQGLHKKKKIKACCVFHHASVCIHNLLCFTGEEPTLLWKLSRMWRNTRKQLAWRSMYWRRSMKRIRITNCEFWLSHTALWLNLYCLVSCVHSEV